MMKNTKRLIGLILCLAMLVEFCPMDALAAGRVASESTIQAAWELSGQAPNAARWHRGMMPETAWNAEQLDEWLNWVLTEPMFSVQNAHSDLKANLNRMQDSAPEVYGKLMSGNSALYMDYMSRASHRAEDLRQRLRAYRTQLVMNADKIADLIDYLRDDGVSDRDKARYSRQIEKAAEAIRKARADVVDNYRDWLDQIDAMHGDFNGGGKSGVQAVSAPGDSGEISAAGFNDWVRAVMSWHEEPVKSAVAVKLHPDGRNNTVLAKLSVSHSALAAQESDPETIHVISDTQFVVNLSAPVEPAGSSAPDPAPSPMPVENARVTVWDAKEVKNPDTIDPYTTSAITEQVGDATFNVSEFTVDDEGLMHVGILAEADGYQLVKHCVAEVAKGGVYSIPLSPDGVAQAANDAAPGPDKPEFYHVSYNNMDVLKVQKVIYYSPENNVLCDIKVGIRYPDGYAGSKDVTMKYRDADKDADVTVTVPVGDAKPDPDLAGRAYGQNCLVYTFTDTWQRMFKPGKTISLYIGSESEGLVENDIMLTVKRGVVDKPMISDSGTGALTQVTKTFGDLGNLFKVMLPSNLKYPFGSSWFELNLPIMKYLPKISYEIDGTLTVAYGIDPGEIHDHGGDTTPEPGTVTPAPTAAAGHWYDDHTWKSKTQREIDREAKRREGETNFSKYKAKCGATWDGIKTKCVSFLGNMSISMGAFAMITVQFEAYNEQGGDDPSEFYCNSRSMSLTVGAIATFSAEATWQFAMIGYLSLGFSASLAMGLTVGGAWYKFDPAHGHFGSIQWAGTSGLTVMVKLMITVTLGFGVKGLVSASITGFGYFNILIQWTKASGPTPWVRITLGAGMTACVTVFWLKYNLTIWKSPEKVIYDNQPNPTAFNLLDVFTQPALAEDEAETPEAMTPLEPEYYPALVPEATQVMDDVAMRNTMIQYADLDGTTFAFYIAATGDGKDRLTWRNLKTGQTGNVQAALQEIADAEAQEDEYRVVDKIDYAFDVQGETLRENVDLPPTVLAAVLCTSSLADETFETDGQTVTVKAPTDSCAYYLMLASDGKGGLYNPFFDKDIPQFPAIGHKKKHGFVSMALECACGEIELDNYALSSVATQGTIQFYIIVIHSAAREYIPHNADAGMDTGRIANAYIYTALPDFFDNQSVTTTLNDSIPLLDGNSVRLQCRSGFPASVISKCSTWYALEKAGDDAPGTLVHGMDLAGEGDRLTAIKGFDDDVVFYRNVLQSYGRWDHTDDVFYLARTADDNGEHHWLKRAGVTSQTNYDDSACFTSAYTVTDYDVEVKAESFCAQKVNGVIYVYWLATAPKEKETDPDVYRIKSVVYDPYSDTMSNEMVLAEFSMPDADLTPASLFLSESGTGYCTAVVGSGDDLRSDVYSFPVNWVTSLELNAMTLSDTHTNPASWLDTVVSVMNSGNTGISALDLELYVVADDGTETVVEKLHCDCLNPENSAIYEGDVKVSTGDHTIIRLEDAVQPFQQTDHNVTRKHWTHGGGGENQPDEYIDSAMLLPGAVKSYSVPIYIPVDWDGYKTLLLRVAMNATRANWLAANAAGTASNVPKAARDAEANPEIVYTRAADGTMVRTDSAAQNGALLRAGAADFAPSYPDAVKATRPLALNHDIHDLKVTHRVYRDANGEDYIAITFLNHADTGRPLELDACIYMDGDETPLELELPYYPGKTTDSYTHTVTLRMDALLGGHRPRNARVVIKPYGVEETALRNNQFTLHFDDEDVDDPLRLAVQPSSVAAQVGETVTFTVAAEGGVKPYTYQWQAWMGEKKGWQDIPGSSSPTLTVEGVTAAMHGRKARCVVTDHYLNRVVSEAAALTVSGKLPETGDDTNLPLYIAAALLSLAALWWIRRRERRT